MTSTSRFLFLLTCLVMILALPGLAAPAPVQAAASASQLAAETSCTAADIIFILAGPSTALEWVFDAFATARLTNCPDLEARIGVILASKKDAPRPEVAMELTPINPPSFEKWAETRQAIQANLKKNEAIAGDLVLAFDEALNQLKLKPARANVKRYIIYVGNPVARPVGVASPGWYEYDKHFRKLAETIKTVGKNVELTSVSALLQTGTLDQYESQRAAWAWLWWGFLADELGKELVGQIEPRPAKYDFFKPQPTLVDPVSKIALNNAWEYSQRIFDIIKTSTVLSAMKSFNCGDLTMPAYQGAVQFLLLANDRNTVYEMVRPDPEAPFGASPKSTKTLRVGEKMDPVPADLVFPRPPAAAADPWQTNNILVFLDPQPGKWSINPAKGNCAVGYYVLSKIDALNPALDTSKPFDQYNLDGKTFDPKVPHTLRLSLIDPISKQTIRLQETLLPKVSATLIRSDGKVVPLSFTPAKNSPYFDPAKDSDRELWSEPLSVAEPGTYGWTAAISVAPASGAQDVAVREFKGEYRVRKITSVFLKIEKPAKDAQFMLHGNLWPEQLAIQKVDVVAYLEDDKGARLLAKDIFTTPAKAISATLAYRKPAGSPLDPAVSDQVIWLETCEKEPGMLCGQVGQDHELVGDYDLVAQIDPKGGYKDDFRLVGLGAPTSFSRSDTILTTRGFWLAVAALIAALILIKIAYEISLFFAPIPGQLEFSYKLSKSTPFKVMDLARIHRRDILWKRTRVLMDISPILLSVHKIRIRHAKDESEAILLRVEMRNDRREVKEAVVTNGEGMDIDENIVATYKLN